MIETDIAVPVTDLVVTESDLTPILGARRYQDTGLRTGLSSFNLKVFNRDHGAVEQLLLPSVWRRCAVGRRARSPAARSPVRPPCPG